MALHTFIDDSDEEFLYISIFNLHCVICPSLYRTVFLLQTRNCLGHNKSPAFTFSKPQHPTPKNTPTLVIRHQVEAFLSTQLHQRISTLRFQLLFAQESSTVAFRAVNFGLVPRASAPRPPCGASHVPLGKRIGAFRTVGMDVKGGIWRKNARKTNGFLKIMVIWKVILLLGQVHRVLNPCSNQFT